MPKITLPNNWAPRPYQLDAWRYLEKGGKHAELIWHRRSGKDELGLHRTACAAFERVANYWYMLPKYNQARKAIWDAVNPHTGKRRIDEAIPHELRKSVNNQEMKIVLLNDSVLQVVGSDNPDSLVGSPPAGIVYSEWALSNPDVRAYLRPILMENGGWQIFNTTPRGRNHALRTYEAAKKDPKAFAQILDATQTGVFTKEQLAEELERYIEDFGEDYGKSKFEQEYLCSFDAANIGAILARSIAEADRSGRIGPQIEFDIGGAPIEISCDIGRRDTSTWWFWQPTYGGFNIVDYDGGFGIDAEDWCDRLVKKLAQYRLKNGEHALGKIWLPHDARAKTFAAKHSAVEIFANYFGANKIAITPDSKKADRINAARTVIRHVAFSDKCEKGLDGLRAWAYKWDDERKMFSSEPDHDWASHDGDGFSYGCLIMRQRKVQEKDKDPVFPVQAKNQSSIVLEPLNQLWKTSTQRRDRL